MPILFTEEYLSKVPATPGQLAPRTHWIARADHSAGFREWMEHALSFYQKDKLPQVLGNLQSKNDVNSLSAEYEVIWFELLRQWFGALPEVEPSVNRANPDFRVKTGAGPLIVEVATLHEQEDVRVQGSTSEQVREYLHEVEHFYWLDMGDVEAIPKNFSKKALRHAVRQRLDAAHAGREEGGSFTLDVPGTGPDEGRRGILEVEFHRRLGWPNGEWTRKPVEVIFLRHADVKAVDRTKELLKGKMDQLRGVKDQRMPLLLAICDGGFFSTGEDGLYHAIFGHDQIAFKNDEKGRLRPAGWQLARDGFFTPNTADGAHYRWVSALAYAHRALWNGRPAVWIRLYKNPWALTPLPDQLFVDIPRVYGLEEREGVWRITGDKRTRMYFYLDEAGKAESEKVVPPDMTVDI